VVVSVYLVTNLSTIYCFSLRTIIPCTLRHCSISYHYITFKEFFL